MPQRFIGPVDNATPMDVNVVCQSLHVVAYRVWHRRPSVSKEWKIVGDGQTADDKADHFQLNVTRDDEIAYWLGIGGTKPNIPYAVVITLAQAGKVLDGGALVETGPTDGEGVAVVNDGATLR